MLLVQGRCFPRFSRCNGYSPIFFAMRLTFTRATPDDVPALIALKEETASALTARFGDGHWSAVGTEKGTLHQLAISAVFVAKRGRAVIATFRLSTRKPWAIDKSYFSAAENPLYLTDMAVRVEEQGAGVGRRCVEQMVHIARAWPADAIRLDAYDAPAGAGLFYGRCGFRHVADLKYREVSLSYYEMRIPEGG